MKTKFFLKTIIAALFFPVLLFAIAGTLDYFQGWIFLLTTLLTALMNYATIRNDAALMTERSQAGPGAKSWDKISPRMILSHDCDPRLDRERSHGTKSSWGCLA